MAERQAPSSHTDQQAEREFTSLLINLYREWPVLWKVKDKEYFNKSKKNAAWEKVLNGLRVFKPNYTIDDIKKKINGLRTNFNREYKAIEAKKRSVTSADNISGPSLWYYNDIIFIKDQIDVATNETCGSQLPLNLQVSSGSQPPFTASRKHPTKKTKRVLDTTDVLLGLASEYFKRPSSEKEEDIVSKGWAMKIMRMAQDQRRYAERIITDVLFDGEMGSLTWEGVRFVTSNRPWSQTPTSI